MPSRRRRGSCCSTDLPPRHVRAGDLEYAQTLTGKLAAKDPKDLASQLTLFELAARKGDEEAMRQTDPEAA